MEYHSVRSKGFKKFTQEEWLDIEKEISAFEMKVCQCMKKLGKGEAGLEEETVIRLQSIGEDLYLTSVRKVLEKFKFVKPLQAKNSDKDEVKGKKKAPKKGSKQDQKNKKEDKMILNINCVKFQEKAESYFKDFDMNSKELSKTYGIEREPDIEIKIMILMYFSKVLRNEINKEAGYEFIVGVSRILRSLKKENSFAVKPSETCIQDLEMHMEELKKFYSYSPIEIFTEFPRLILHTSYSSYFPLYDVTPYKNQVELITSVKKLYKENSAGLILFKSNIGTGKTTVAVALASSINLLREMTGKNTQLIFACSIEVVRHYVGRLAYNAKISFAVANSTDRGPKIINSFSCKNNSSPNLIITDLYTANSLLENKNDYILFIDEPTYEADNLNSNTLKYFKKVFSNSPKITILSSATLPTELQMKSYINYYKYVLHKNAEILTIISQDNFVGCQVFDHNFDSYMPHQNCKTVEELKKVLSVLFQDSLLRRCYTAKSLFNFYSKIVDLAKEKEFIHYYDNILPLLPDFKTVFNDVENISQNKILELSKEVLESLVTSNNDKFVEIVCKSDKNENVGENKQLDCKELGTVSSHKFLNGCLIVTDNPLQFALKNFKAIYEPVSENLKREVKNYFKSINDYKEDKKIFEHKYGDKPEVLMNKLKLLSCPSCFSIPSKYEINTAAHLTKYAGSNNANLKTRRTGIINEKLLEMLLKGTIDLDLLSLLLCGVGVYDNNSMEDFYLQEVLRLAQDGSIAFIVSNFSLAYGANFPINNVIVTENFGENLTISTLFQIMGRAGRVGYSWAANAYLNEKTIQNVDGYIKNNENAFNLEAHNLSQALERELGLDFKKDNVVQSFTTNNKILIVYRYNDPKSIFSAILIILYHLSLIRKSFLLEQKINLNVFFEFVKLNTEVLLTSNYKIEFRNEKYNTIYFLGMYPHNPKNVFAEASSHSRKVVVFESYSSNKKLENSNFPENVLIFSSPSESNIMKETFNYVSKQLDDDLTELTCGKVIFNPKYYLQMADIFAGEKTGTLSKKDQSLIDSFHSLMHNYNTKKKNISYKLIYEFLSVNIKEKIEKQLLLYQAEDATASEIVNDKLQMFIFDGKLNTSIDYDYLNESNAFEEKIRKVYEIFGNRKYDLFLGLIIERKELKYISTICNILRKKYEQFEIPCRFLVFYDCYLEENSKSKCVCYFYVNDGKNAPIKYLEGRNESRCDETEGLFLINKNRINDWTLF